MNTTEEEADILHFCDRCGTPTWATRSTLMKPCPKCRIAERDWYKPTPVVQSLLEQIDAIKSYYKWATGHRLTLETWLKDAIRIEEGRDGA